MIPATGQINLAVLEADGRCDEIAKILLAIRRDLAHINFARRDKRHLRAGLARHAYAWPARGRVCGAPQRPDDVEPAVARIVAHERASVREVRSVREYLREVNPRRLA